jgi:hypothetical protein
MLSIRAHIHQGTRADEMECPVGKLIVRASEQEVHSLDEPECRNGRIDDFPVE